jgi:hypothetical protein
MPQNFPLYAAGIGILRYQAYLSPGHRTWSIQINTTMALSALVTIDLRRCHFPRRSVPEKPGRGRPRPPPACRTCAAAPSTDAATSRGLGPPIRDLSARPARGGSTRAPCAPKTAATAVGHWYYRSGLHMIGSSGPRVWPRGRTEVSAGRSVVDSFKPAECHTWLLKTTTVPAFPTSRRSSGCGVNGGQWPSRVPNRWLPGVSVRSLGVFLGRAD